jgi:exonuclease SbcC
MIPLELRLTNFLSYRDEAQIDLRAIHLACISGANGAGKSTLLDAMTWALFGQSRVRSDDDLVHTSARDGQGAQVELVFDMEGVPYRVIRGKRPGKSANLEFQVGHDADGATKWQSLTEARNTETQAAIERVLRMNYDIFVNASFFLQGQADEFTKRTPGKRKEILAEVLGVTQWDDFAKRAAGQRKTSETDLVILKRRLEEIAAELAESEARQQRLDEALRQQTEVQQRLAEKETYLQQARQVQALLAQQQRQVAARAGEVTTLSNDLAQLTQRIAQRRDELAQYEAILSEAAQIETDHAAWKTADEAIQTWQSLAEAVHKLQAEQSPLQSRIAAARSGLEQRLRGLEAQQAEVAAGEVQQQTILAELVTHRQGLAELAAQAETMAAGDAELRVLELEVERLRSERRGREGERQRLAGELARVDKARAERETVAAALAAEQERATALATDLVALAQLGETVAGWTAERDQMALQRAQLQEEAAKEKARADQLAAEEGAECPLCGQPLTAAHRVEVVQQLEADLAAKRDAYRKARDRESELKVLLGEQADLAARRARLQRDHDAQQGRVSAAADRLRSLDQTISVWLESEGDAQLLSVQKWLAEQPDLAGKQAEIDALRTAVAGKAELDRRRDGLQQQIIRAESQLEQIERQAKVWHEKGRPELEQVTQQLASAAYAATEQAQLAEIQQRIDALSYDAAAHQTAVQQRQALAAAPQRLQSLRQAEAALKPLQQSLDEALGQQAAWQTKHAALETQLAEERDAMQALQASALDSAALEREVIRLREEDSIATQQVGAMKQKVAVLEDRRRQEQQLQKDKKALDGRIQQLKLLEEACGRKGVQALLIENALPEIEDRANELLDRLSGGAMRVTFDTQRALKSRDAMAETLEIHISDAAGQRPYENYSGGEQFRVNFAVRLALSQVLAHRAGARLRTLVIDEGFGSQDPEGRQRLIEAINAVQSDFERILVITHIDELRDAFPARIEVSKSAGGSQVTVVAG